jgi:Mrp family chromosome partitioning ATPase
LEALRTEKRQIEQRLATGANDNPYAGAERSPEVLNRRLAEIKNTIARREKALKDPQPTSPPSASPDLVAQWRQLLAELAAAQAAASVPAAAGTPVTAQVTARAPLPTSPLTPNRLVLSVVALLLSAAAALVAYVLPRKAEPARRGSRSAGPTNTEPIRAALAPGVSRSETPRPRSEPPLPRTDPPPPERPAELLLGPRPASDPPAAIAVQRTVVLSGPSGSSAPAGRAARSHTSPGGLEAPPPHAPAAAGRALTTSAPGHTPAAAPRFGSRPPPGAGSYSVSSSHPPPIDSRGGAGRTSIERLSPLHSAHPPPAASTAAPGPSPRRAAAPEAQSAGVPQIVSRPPALDPEAESWAAHFEAPPPAEPTRPTHPQPTRDDSGEEAPRKKAGRWKTQVMGSMVPLEVMTARNELPPPSEEIESARSIESVRSRALARQAPSPSATTIVHQDVPLGWVPPVFGNTAELHQLRDAVLQAATGRSLTLLVTGTARTERAQVASGLALALAEAGARTLLVEADFDNPELHRTLSLSTPPGAGFSQQLKARRTARHPEPWTVLRCSNNLSVLAEGRFRSPGLVVSREFESALTDLSEQHHIVLVHAPTLAQADDLRPLSPLAQAAVLVEAGKPTQLRLTEDPLRGLI